MLCAGSWIILVCFLYQVYLRCAYFITSSMFLFPPSHLFFKQLNHGNVPALIAPIFCVFLNFAIAVEWRRSTCFCRSVFTSQPKDVIVLGLGISERPGIASAYLEREAHDRDSIDLPEAQKDLAKKIIALGKPTIIFLLNGGGPAIFCFFC